MQITIERSGGFAGLRRTWKINGDDLQPAELRKVEKLAAAVLSPDIPDSIKSPGADLFQYRITVETPARTRTIQVQAEEGKIPAPVHALIEWVQTHS